MSKFIAASAGLALAAGALAGNSYNGTGGAIADAVGTVPTTTSFDIVVGDSFTVADASVELNISHTWVGDLSVTLSNGSNSINLFNRPGFTGTGFGDNSNLGGAYLFADGGADFAAAAAAAIGTDAIVAPGTYAANGSFASTFGGGGSAGTWTLSITDNAGGDIGNLSGWTLNLVPVPTPGAAALLGLAGVAGLRRRR
ncbi:MAG: proprotein convertase P-domain-containing protein [Phycisphaerales bacterium]